MSAPNSATATCMIVVGGLAACGSPRGGTVVPPNATASAVVSAPTTPTPPASAVASGSRPSEPERSGTVVDKVVFPEPAVTASRIAVDPKGNRFVIGSFSASATFGDLEPLSARGQDAFVVKLDPKNKPVWAKRFGGNDADIGLDIAADATGNVYISIAFESGSLDLGTGTLKNAGLHDLVLAKLDNDGKVLWAKRYGDANDQMALRLHAYPGGVIATGWFNGSLDFGAGSLFGAFQKAFFVANIDPSGKGIWSKAFGHRIDFAETDSAVDDRGDVFASGGSDGSSDFVRGGVASLENDLGPVLVALDASGKTIAAKRFGGGADNLTTAIAVDRKNAVRIAAASHGVMSFDGDARRPQNGFAALVVANFDRDATLWKREVFLSRQITVAAGALDADGNYYVSGLFDEDDPTRGVRQDGYVVKLTASGQIDWTLKIAEGTAAALSGIAMDPSGRPVMVANVSGASGSNTEMWVGTLVP